MKKIMILILGILIFTSCSDSDNEEIIGKWGDIIKLSINNVELTSHTDSVTITTKGDWWWIDSISFNDSTYGYYGREDVDLESNYYYIVEEHFLVEKRDKNTLFVKINDNNTGDERIMDITFEAGDYFDYVRIKQAGN